MEYEYSFKVSSIEKYLEYCINNNYTLKNEINQTRTIYRKEDKTIARITIEKGNTTIKKLDFKEDNLSNSDLIIRKESKDLIFNDLESCESILDFLGYKKDNTLIRNRYIYTLDEVKFEIDKYIEPEKCYVVAVEGSKDKADKVYRDLEPINNIYKI